jgi:hypothetical protein
MESDTFECVQSLLLATLLAVLSVLSVVYEAESARGEQNQPGSYLKQRF